jgi:signal transduction histidine kinase
MQVFQNLLSNAIKYMDKPQGQIVVGCVEEDGFWKFSVSDNGPGIEEAHYERIFQIFQTLAPRDEVESTGVGLSVVKKIVELYGGKIWVESKLGEGCTFFFTLPKQEIEMGLKDAKLEANIAC